MLVSSRPLSSPPVALPFVSVCCRLLPWPISCASCARLVNAHGGFQVVRGHRCVPSSTAQAPPPQALPSRSPLNIMLTPCTPVKSTVASAAAAQSVNSLSRSASSSPSTIFTYASRGEGSANQPYAWLTARSILPYRPEEHTYELQSLMRTTYAVFCLPQKNTPHRHT